MIKKILFIFVIHVIPSFCMNYNEMFLAWKQGYTLESIDDYPLNNFPKQIEKSHEMNFGEILSEVFLPKFLLPKNEMTITHNTTTYSLMLPQGPAPDGHCTLYIEKNIALGKFYENWFIYRLKFYKNNYIELIPHTCIPELKTFECIERTVFTHDGKSLIVFAKVRSSNPAFWYERKILKLQSLEIQKPKLPKKTHDAFFRWK